MKSSLFKSSPYGVASLFPTLGIVLAVIAALIFGQAVDKLLGFLFVFLAVGFIIFTFACSVAGIVLSFISLYRVEERLIFAAVSLAVNGIILLLVAAIFLRLI